ncbi:MAG TPA: FtsX-like permease family protein, partial [Vicinamibacterales bacterium]|nr:FtsX-like permease family protein [Vicinamibacterales bacterium]
ETASDAAAPAALVRAQLKAVDPRLEPRQLVTMDQYIRFAASDYQATAALAVALAAIGLLLTAIGVYSVIASRTTRRTREIGIRVALGATRREILTLVLGDGGRMALAGFVIGFPAALVTARLLRSLLFGVDAWDTVVLSGATTVLVLTVLSAALGPAWRATRISPSTALRETV